MNCKMGFVFYSNLFDRGVKRFKSFLIPNPPHAWYVIRHQQPENCYVSSSTRQIAPSFVDPTQIARANGHRRCWTPSAQVRSANATTSHIQRIFQVNGAFDVSHSNNVFATTLNEDTKRSFIVGEHNNASAMKSHHPRSASHHLLQARCAKVLNSKSGFTPPGSSLPACLQRFELRNKWFN